MNPLAVWRLTLSYDYGQIYLRVRRADLPAER